MEERKEKSVKRNEDRFQELWGRMKEYISMALGFKKDVIMPMGQIKILKEIITENFQNLEKDKSIQEPEGQWLIVRLNPMKSTPQIYVCVYLHIYVCVCVYKFSKVKGERILKSKRK